MYSVTDCVHNEGEEEVAKVSQEKRAVVITPSKDWFWSTSEETAAVLTVWWSQQKSPLKIICLYSTVLFNSAESLDLNKYSTSDQE